MQRARISALFIFLTLSLGACGGGSDKGSGGQFDGFYRGTETINGTTLNLEINIRAGRVTVTDVADDDWKGDINSGGDFRASRSMHPLCNGESRYQGQVTGRVISGTFREVGNCVDNDSNGPFRVEFVSSPRRSTSTDTKLFKSKR